MTYRLKGDLVDIRMLPHVCKLPHFPWWYWFGRSKWAGYIVQCDCGKRYLWEQQWSWHEYLGWGWSEA